MGVRGVESKRPDRLRPPSPPSSHTHTHTPLPQHPSLPRGGGGGHCIFFAFSLDLYISIGGLGRGALALYSTPPLPRTAPRCGRRGSLGPGPPPPRHAQQSTFPSPPPRGITYRNGTGRCYTYARAERGRWELKRIILLSLPELKSVCVVDVRVYSIYFYF